MSKTYISIPSTNDIFVTVEYKAIQHQSANLRTCHCSFMSFNNALEFVFNSLLESGDVIKSSINVIDSATGEVYFCYE